MDTKLGIAAQEDGFSLLELIVAMTLLSFIAVALASGLRVGITAWTRISGAQETPSDIYFSQSAIRRFIETARPISVDETHPESGLEFSGQSNRLLFVSPMPAEFGMGGDYMIEFAVRTRASGQKDLVLLPRIYRGPGHTSEGTASADNETTLVADVVSASWTYFGSSVKREMPSWRTTWESQILLPQLIGLDVSFPAGSNRIWPQLLIAPRLR